MLKLILPKFFQLSTWTSLQKTFSLVSSAYMYGCQLFFAHVLCSAFIFAIYFCLSLAKCGQILTICLSCLVFSWYATDCTLLIPSSSMFFLSAQLRINFGQISVYYNLCLPCILHVHYWAYWLCLFAIWDSCKGPTEDGLFGLVSYRVPLAPRQSILKPTPVS